MRDSRQYDHSGWSFKAFRNNSAKDPDRFGEVSLPPGSESGLGVTVPVFQGLSWEPTLSPQVF